jgi:hypothetical protein
VEARRVHTHITDEEKLLSRALEDAEGEGGGPHFVSKGLAYQLKVFCERRMMQNDQIMQKIRKMYSYSTFVGPRGSGRRRSDQAQTGEQDPSRHDEIIIEKDGLEDSGSESAGDEDAEEDEMSNVIDFMTNMTV